MDQAAPQTQSDPGYLRSRDNYHHLQHTLSAILPPPPTDTPEDRARRDNAAIAQVVALCPANATEASLAAQYVAANAHAMDCLGLSNVPAGESVQKLKCSAQAASMMRQAQGALRMLQRLQEAREKREADDRRADRAAWTEHCAGELMAEASPAAPARQPAQVATQDPWRTQADPPHTGYTAPQAPDAWANPVIHIPATLRRSAPLRVFARSEAALAAGLAEQEAPPTADADGPPAEITDTDGIAADRLRDAEAEYRHRAQGGAQT